MIILTNVNRFYFLFQIWRVILNQEIAIFDPNIKKTLELS